MEELIEKLNEVKEKLDKTECIINIRKLNKVIKEDKELLNLIEEYKYKKDDKIKERIIYNNNYREYKHWEVELNFIILEINKRLKQINGKRKCSK